jgi:hypothetical protein
MRLEYSSPLVGWQTSPAGLLITSRSASSWTISNSFFQAHGCLSATRRAVSLLRVNEKWNKWLPILLMFAFALSRWPGLLPWNFSAYYALCVLRRGFPATEARVVASVDHAGDHRRASQFLSHRQGYNAWQVEILFNYVAVIVLIWLGTRFNPRGSLWKIISGGLIGPFCFT